MIFNVEVQLFNDGRAVDRSELENAVKDYLQANKWNCSEPIFFEGEDKNLIRVGNDHVVSINVENSAPQSIAGCDMSNNDEFVMSIYNLHMQNMETETLDEAGDGAEESVPCINHYLLPNRMFNGMWSHLIYEEGLKEELLNYAISALEFAEHKVNPEVITCNRLLLLHGPPGTGKTSLCKALAQKLAIRTFHKYRYMHLIEINSHSLFSKWFSESGKLVMRLFAKIRDMISDPDNLVCVIIDEVESLAFSRHSMSSQEPKDAMRVVNALLTQLDSIKEHSNAFVFATSNLSENIDNAFIDRADIKQFIGFPKPFAIISIYESILRELSRVGIVKDYAPFKDNAEWRELIKESEGLNGRTIRKLPFLAYPKIKQHLSASKNISENAFISGMYEALCQYKNSRKHLKN